MYAEKSVDDQYKARGIVVWGFRMTGFPEESNNRWTESPLALAKLNPWGYHVSRQYLCLHKRRFRVGIDHIVWRTGSFTVA